jgi:hypothetical protein
MRATRSFWTSTSATAAEVPLSTTSHRLEVLGWDRAARRVYFVEHADERRTLLVMALEGEHAGYPLPMSGESARIEAVRRSLIPMRAVPVRGWELTTRVVQRRGLRLVSTSTPIRKFALGLGVTQRTGGVTISVGRATVTAYLRPRAVIDCVWAIPGEGAHVAIVTYCGVPAGIGFDKQTPILVTPLLQ